MKGFPLSEGGTRTQGSDLFLRSARRMVVPLMAKQTTDPRAAISIRLALKRKTSAETAAIAKRRPNTFSQSGARTLLLASLLASLFNPVPAWALRSLRRRSCSRRAAIPMAATTTSASGLEKAERLV